MLPKVLLGLLALLAATEVHAMRWYSPSTGRWFSRDPIGEEAFFTFYAPSQTRAVQRQLRRERLQPLYVFIGNAPLNNVDVLGLEQVRVGTKYIANESLPVGHAALEISGAGYGFGPKDRDGNVFNTPGTTSGWDSVPVPRFEWPLYINKSAQRYFKDGGPRTSCCNATPARIKQCADWFAQKWEGTTYSAPFRTCRTYADVIIYSCCINEGMRGHNP